MFDKPNPSHHGYASERDMENMRHLNHDFSLRSIIVSFLALHIIVSPSNNQFVAQAIKEQA